MTSENTSGSCHSGNKQTGHGCGCTASEGSHSITAQELRQKLAGETPNNSDKAKGYALVNVLPPEYFAKEHIPGSINIQYDDISEFERRFDKNKEIIVYCASVTCTAGPDTAKALSARGFAKARDFPGGSKEWKESGNALSAEKGEKKEGCGCC